MVTRRCASGCAVTCSHDKMDEMEVGARISRAPVLPRIVVPFSPSTSTRRQPAEGQRRMDPRTSDPTWREDDVAETPLPKKAAFISISRPLHVITTHISETTIHFKSPLFTRGCDVVAYDNKNTASESTVHLEKAACFNARLTPAMLLFSALSLVKLPVARFAQTQSMTSIYPVTR